MERSEATPPAACLPLPVKALLHAGFVLTGVVNTLLGPILPALSAKWSLTDSQAGWLFTAQFAGSILGVLLSSRFVVRWGSRVSLVLGYGMMSAGVGSLGLGAWEMGLLSIFCSGVGFGVAIPTTNLLVAEASPGRRAAVLSILNLAWGGGAVAWPLLADLVQRTNNTRAFLIGLAGALGVVLLCFVPAFFAEASSGNRPPPAEHLFGPRGHVWSSRFVMILGTLFFLYVGTETALGGWVASYAQRISPIPGTAWVITPSFFWGALLLGRALAPAILRRVSEGVLAVTGLLLAALGIAGLLVATTRAGLIAGIGLAGLGLASVFPITVALLFSSLGASASRLAGPMFALGGLGGATLPWLVGFSSTYFGTLKAGLVVPLLASLTMAALHLVGSRSSNANPLLSWQSKI